MSTAMTLIVPTAFGLEAVAGHELREMGYSDARVENGRVLFSGDATALARANLWLRTGERVLIRLGEFPARTFDELFEGTLALPWEDFLPRDAMFPVEGKSHLSQLSSVPACQSIAKKAIVEAMRRRYRQERFEESGARFRILVALHKDTATLTLDTTGIGLHKRGYRQMSPIAPLRETLAASIILISRWGADRILLDPMCGSGTLPIEAAMMARNIAPGVTRQFDSSEWPLVPEAIWQAAREEARDLARPEAEVRGIYGSDCNPEVLSMARYHAKLAGVEDLVHFEKKRVQDFQTKRKYGVFVTNPPYGERLGEKPEVDKLYSEMGQVLSRMETWSSFVLTSHVGFEKLLGRQAHKKRKLFNGNLRCDLYQYFGPLPPRGRQEAAEEQDDDPQA